MNKASNVSIGKRLLMLLLSIAMVFTMMPLTSAVSYADEATPITSAEEFAAMDAAGNYVLANDITVDTPYPNDFSGTFDGNGHTVTLAIEADGVTYQALFKTLVGGATIKNLVTDGSVSVTGSKSYTGGVAGKASGEVTIANCVNNASVSGYKAVGGLVGWSMSGVVITGCVNNGTVTGANNQVGGFVGNNSTGALTIENCYNTGSVTGFNMTGGFVGQATKKDSADALVNCYNTGAITITSTNSNVGALVGNKSNSGTLTNCYFLEGSAAAAVGGATVEGAVSKTAEEMQAAEFVAALNGDGDAFAMDTDGINGGYPVLSWQGGGEPPAPQTVPVTAVTIEGTAKTGETLTAIATGADGAEPTNVTYQWQYEDSEWDDDEWDYVTSYVNIEGATGKTYTIAADMAGKKLRVVASGDEESSATSDLTATVAKGDDALVAEAAKALTNPFAEEYKEDAQVTLPATGKNNTTITWESSDSAVISNDGKVTLPETGISEVTMTATISLNEQSTTKEFKVSVISEESQQNPPDATVIKDIVKKFDSISTLRPSYGKDTNINDFAAAQIKAFTGIQGFDPAKVSVALKSSDKPETIAADGTINYVQKDTPDQSGINSVNVSCEFTITYGEATADTSKKTASIGWDREAFQVRMQAEADGLTIDKILGENESAEAVTKELSLPQCMGTSARQVWSVITWTSSNENVISFKEEPYSGITTPLKGVVNPAADDTEVTLTATFKANDTILNTNLESLNDFETITKEFKVTVPGTGQQGPTEEELQEILNTYYTDDLLAYAEGDETFDINAVTGDIQLPLYTKIKDENGNLVFENKEITVTSSDENVITINGYRANVDRFQNENKTVDLTVSFTRGGLTVSKVIKVTVVAITDAELDAELAAMEKVKEHYFDGINDGRYENKDAITGDLHAFQEANVGEDGEVSWVYDVNNKTGAGIISDGFWDEGQSEQMEASGYNRFKSSEPSVIQHENLKVTVPEHSTQVTITSWLSSERYGKYAPAHPDNEKLQQLYKQEVSATVTVKGEKDDPVEPQGPADPAEVTLTVNNKGELALDKDGEQMVERDVLVTDIDEDGHLTYDEALVAAHDEYFEGGAAAGYSVSGGAVKKLWGNESTNNLFLINGQGITTGVTADTVEEGDALYASVNADETYYSDWYAAFTETSQQVAEGSDITVKLVGHLGMAYEEADKKDVPLKGLQIGYTDEDNKFVPIEGAVTDENGEATFTLPGGDYVLSAQGTVEGVVTDWSMISDEASYGTKYVKYDDEAFEDSGFGVGYTEADLGDGPYPLSEVKWIEWMEWYAERDDFAGHLLTSNQFIADCPIMAPYCNLTVTVPADPEEVSLTVSNQGVLAADKDGKAMAERPVTVKDIDGDGYLTYDEALVAAHDEYFEGGAKAGYKVGGAYGSVQKLWGVDTTNTLFYVNEEGLGTGVLSDTVEEGDSLYASVNKDNEYYADWYAKFAQTDMTAVDGEEITVNVTGHYGMAWQDEDKINVPLEGIKIGLWKNGKFEPIDGAVTNAKGNATFKLPKGEYLLTAEGTVKDDVYDWATSTTVTADCPIMAPFCKLEVVKDDQVNEKIQEALSELEKQDISAYRTNEQVQVLSLMMKTQMAVTMAENSSEVDALMADFRAALAKVKTDAAYTAEEKAAKIKAVKAAQIGGVKAAAGDRQAAVSWTKDGKMSGYEISYQKKGAAAKTVKVTNPASVKKTIAKLAAGKYTFKVRGYLTLDGKTYNSKWSKAATATVLSSTAVKNAQIAGMKVKAGDKKANVSWKKNAKMDGYQISYQKKGAKAKTVKVTGQATVKKTVTKLAAAKYTFKVRGYKVIGGKTFYSKWSKSKAVKVPSSAAVKKAKIAGVKVKAGSKKATISWKKNTKMDGYQIWYKKPGKAAKKIKVTKQATVKKTISKLTKGKTYKFKVRGYKKIDGKTYYSKWSKVKKAKIKK